MDRWVLYKLIVFMISIIISVAVFIAVMIKTPSDYFTLGLVSGIILLAIVFAVEAYGFRGCLLFKPCLRMKIRCISDDDTYLIGIDNKRKWKYCGPSIDERIVVSPGEHKLTVCYNDMCQQKIFVVNEIKRVNVSIQSTRIEIDEHDEPFDRDPATVQKGEKRMFSIFTMACITMTIAFSIIYATNFFR